MHASEWACEGVTTKVHRESSMNTHNISLLYHC